MTEHRHATEGVVTDGKVGFRRSECFACGPRACRVERSRRPRVWLARAWRRCWRPPIWWAGAWEDVAEREDGEVYELLFPGRGERHSVFIQPDWARVHKEMARVGVTLKLLHGEYADQVGADGGLAMS